MGCAAGNLLSLWHVGLEGTLVLPATALRRVYVECWGVFAAHADHIAPTRACVNAGVGTSGRRIGGSGLCNPTTRANLLLILICVRP